MFSVLLNWPVESLSVVFQLQGFQRLCEDQLQKKSLNHPERICQVCVRAMTLHTETTKDRESSGMLNNTYLDRSTAKLVDF